jgi:polysaccharide export outer membrane protein
MKLSHLILIVIVTVLMSACGSGRATYKASEMGGAADERPESEYMIGPGDALQIFVWDHEDLSTSVAVRPDGKISTPLVEDLQAAGRTPTQLARDIEAILSE